MNTIVLVGARGDPEFLAKQMHAQEQNWSMAEKEHSFGETKHPKKNLVIIDAWGSQFLGCTPKSHPTTHPDTQVLTFMLNAIRHPHINVFFVPSRIDKKLMRNSEKHSVYMSGSGVQKKEFSRTIRQNLEDIKGVCCDTLDWPVKVRRAEHTHACNDLLVNIPRSFWPTAFEINGHVLEPFGSSAYFGCCGSELQGMLATALFSALRECRSAPSKFHSTFVNEGHSIISKYENEISNARVTCGVYDALSGDVNYVPDLAPARQHLSWPRTKHAMLQRFGSDMVRKVGNVPKKSFFQMLDEIMKEQKKICPSKGSSGRKSIKEKFGKRKQKHDKNSGNIAATAGI